MKTISRSLSRIDFIFLPRQGSEEGGVTGGGEGVDPLEIFGQAAGKVFEI